MYRQPCINLSSASDDGDNARDKSRRLVLLFRRSSRSGCSWVPSLAVAAAAATAETFIDGETRQALWRFVSLLDGITGHRRADYCRGRGGTSIGRPPHGTGTGRTGVERACKAAAPGDSGLICRRELTGVGDTKAARRHIADTKPSCSGDAVDLVHRARFASHSCQHRDQNLPPKHRHLFTIKISTATPSLYCSKTYEVKLLPAVY